LRRFSQPIKKDRLNFTLKIRPVEKEVLIYDFNDMIGAVGGTLGIAVGLSVFGVISCFIDNLSELSTIFHNKKKWSK
jgi:hypothetical protein